MASSESFHIFQFVVEKPDKLRENLFSSFRSSTFRDVVGRHGSRDGRAKYFQISRRFCVND